MSNNNTIDDPDNNNSTKSSNVHRGFNISERRIAWCVRSRSIQGMGEELSAFIKKYDREKKEKQEPTIFHIVSGTSIGAINAAILVSYVKENRTWEGSGQKLIDFWKYLSTHSNVESMNPYFAYYLVLFSYCCYALYIQQQKKANSIFILPQNHFIDGIYKTVPMSW
jgi:hypothetical protein